MTELHAEGKNGVSGNTGVGNRFREQTGKPEQLATGRGQGPAVLIVNLSERAQSAREAIILANQTAALRRKQCIHLGAQRNQAQASSKGPAAKERRDGIAHIVPDALQGNQTQTSRAWVPAWPKPFGTIGTTRMSNPKTIDPNQQRPSSRLGLTVLLILSLTASLIP